MTLTVADIDRWRADLVRAVFHAATGRAEAAVEVASQLSTLAVFDTWNGQTAEARKHQNGVLRKDLDEHGREAQAVAQAAKQAADGIEDVQSKLRTLRSDAAEAKMLIDPLTNTVVTGPDFRGSVSEATAAQRQLQRRLNVILDEANRVDGELAGAINMADGDTPIPGYRECVSDEFQRRLGWQMIKDGFKSAVVTAGEGALLGGAGGAALTPEAGGAGAVPGALGGAVLGFVGGFGKGILKGAAKAGVEAAWDCVE